MKYRLFLATPRRSTSFLLIGLLTLLSLPITYAQNLTGQEIKMMARENFPDAIFKLNSFLELPNNGHYTDQVTSNLKKCNAIFTALNFKTEVISTEGAPLLFAKKMFHQKAKTVLFYLQIDGQAVDTTKWNQPNPYKPELKAYQNGAWEIIDMNRLKNEFNPDWRIFARSASDSKGPAMAFISALEILKDHRRKPRFNIKVIMDFQEELGSPELPGAVVKHKALLKADMLLIMDGTRHVSNLPTLTYGARGIATATLKVFGARYPLHSGQYGNFAPNPVFKMAKLLGGMKDENGRVTINGFYDGVALSHQDKVILQKVPEHKDSIMRRIGISESDGIGTTYQEALQFPSLNIRGLNAGWVGDNVRTIIPAVAIAEIDMRLVPETDGARLMALLKSYILQQGFHLVDSIPSEEERKRYPKLASFNFRLGSLPFRTDMNSEIGSFLNSAMYKVFGNQVVNMRSTGGSQPMSPFITTLNIPAVSIRIPNPDNNIHSADENLRLGNFLEGIMSCLAILEQPVP